MDVFEVIFLCIGVLYDNGRVGNKIFVYKDWVFIGG